MANRSLSNSPDSTHNSNATLTPAVLRRLDRERRAKRPQVPLEAENAATGHSVASVTTLALVGIGIIAVEAARVALVYSALDSFVGNAGGVLPFAQVLTLGLAALDGGLLIRLFAPATAGDSNRTFAIWATVGAWLVVTTANSWLSMYAVAVAMEGEQLAGVAPAAVAVVLLVLRLLLVAALAWDNSAVIGKG